ncbi:pre-mRNA-splicing regulator WTAP-like isoform X1 [Mytilus galloprovincialis]|uniref:pre-mRNA-splicing regulator WTAP-like isoform X1 n=2 Tax=Mytilus galloprovincialis TaxID=29158 RepID=UPI003F7BC971
MANSINVILTGKRVKPDVLTNDPSDKMELHKEKVKFRKKKMSESSASPKRARLDMMALDDMPREELVIRLRDQDKYVKSLEEKSKKDDNTIIRELEEKLHKQQKEAARRENTLVHRLTTKEQELQDYLNQIQEMKQAQTQNTAQLRSLLLDPAVNLVFQRMAKEMDESQEKLKQTQNELSAWKFTPDSQTGKRLMAKCRMLLQENEELGKTINSGRTAKLEGEISLQKTMVQEMKKNQEELDEFLGEVEEDVEGMQSMIYVLQQQLKDSKDQITQLQEDNSRLKQSPSKHSPHKHQSQEYTSHSSEQISIKKEPKDDHESMETDQSETNNDHDMQINHNPSSNQTSSSNPNSPRSHGLVRDYDSSEELSRDWSRSPDQRTHESKDSLYNKAKSKRDVENKTPELDRYSDKDCSNEILRNGVGRTPIKKETLGQV